MENDIYEITWASFATQRERFLCRDLETAKEILDKKIREDILDSKRKELIDRLSVLITPKNFSDLYPRDRIEHEVEKLKQQIRWLNRAGFSRVKAPFYMEIEPLEQVRIREVKVY